MTEYTMFEALCAKLKRDAELMREHGGNDLHEMHVVLNEQDWKIWVNEVAFKNGHHPSKLDKIDTLRYLTTHVTIILHKPGTL